jgi:pyruvate dehydrogenase E2 component (dihydrolipoamide acetyltransferase)
VNVCVAVAVEDGLIAPAVLGTDALDPAEVSRAVADVAERARGGKLKARELTDGTFTLSNLGGFGPVTSFVAIINPPQVAILAVGAIEEKPVVREGDLEVLPMMSLTLTCDHRALDGSVAAEFLGTVRMLLEEPGLAL